MSVVFAPPTRPPVRAPAFAPARPDDRAGAGAGRTLLLGYDVGHDVRRGDATLPVALRATGTLLDRVGRAGAPTRFGGVRVDAAVALREAGLLRPYFVAGVGAYRLQGVDGPAGAVEPARTAAAVLGGAGMRVPVGAAFAFVEARYTTFRGAAGGGYTPVVLGLRF